MNCKYFVEKTNHCRYPGESNRYCVHHASLVGNVRTEDFSDEVYFAPWIGVDYEKRHFFGKRTLVLGNSIYCRDNYTCKERREGSSCPKIHNPACCYYVLESFRYDFSTFHQRVLCIVSGLTKEEIQPDAKGCFVQDSICFYDFVQESLCNGRTPPSPLQCKKSDKAFFEVLEKLRPELIIALGKSHMWEDVPGGPGRYRERWKWVDKPFNYEYTDIYNGYYILNDSTEIPILFIHHPSALGSYDTLFWNRAITAFAE